MAKKAKNKTVKAAKKASTKNTNKEISKKIKSNMPAKATKPKEAKKNYQQATKKPVDKPITFERNHVFTVDEADVDSNGQRKFIGVNDAQPIIVAAGTSFTRVNDTDFDVAGVHPDGVTPFRAVQKMGTTERADKLFNELAQMVLSRGNTKESMVVNNNEPTTQKENKVAPDKADKKSKKNNDVVVSTVNIDDFIKDAPHANTKRVADASPSGIEPLVKNTGMGTGIKLNQMVEANQLSTLEKYADSIHKTINDSFQVRVRGQITKQEVNDILKPCDKTYTYNLRNDGSGFYITVAQGHLTARIPAAEGDFLPVPNE